MPRRTYPDERPDITSLLAEQRTYYDARADDYASVAPPNHTVPGLLPAALGWALVEEAQPRGAVLELACGTGDFTRELARSARSVTALDASPRMLAINRARVANPRVRYFQADLFAWVPDQTYDLVFFGFWLSHVPPSAFDAFWQLVRRCLAPDGRVAFVDDDNRAGDAGDVRPVGDVPVARRTLRDGQEFDIVKVFWQPDALATRLHGLSWDITVRRVGRNFLYGVGCSRRTTD
jgi:demethylmenaquinone methyltransferase/2-methoxy-6-polyprenyl-1,4-benzoquinol methylase